MLKVLRGHSAVVNACAFSSDGQHVLSASSDATLRVWDARTSACVRDFTLRELHGAREALSHSLEALCDMPQVADHWLVANRTPLLYVVSASTGETLRYFGDAEAAASAPPEAAYVAACVSSQGKFVYALTQGGAVHVYDSKRGCKVHAFEAHQDEPLGIAQHPRRNIIVTWGKDRHLKLWRAERF